MNVKRKRITYKMSSQNIDNNYHANETMTQIRDKISHFPDCIKRSMKHGSYQEFIMIFLEIEYFVRIYMYMRTVLLPPTEV